MISTNRIVRDLQIERNKWRHELATDFVKGVIHGLTLAESLAITLQLTTAPFQDNAPFVWKSHIIRKMLNQAKHYFFRGDRAKGLDIIDRILTRRAKGLTS